MNDDAKTCGARASDADVGPGLASGRPAAAPKLWDFRRAGDRYRSFDHAMRANLVADFAGDLGVISNTRVRLRIVSVLYGADQEYGGRVAEALGLTVADVSAVAESARAVAADGDGGGSSSS